MPALDLTVDELLTTTRSVRRRLDFSRPVEPEVLRECLELALQAPSPGNQQAWRFIAVTDPAQRLALGDVYRHGAATSGQDEILDNLLASARDEAERTHYEGMAGAARYLTQHIHEAPVLLVPCMQGRLDGLAMLDQTAYWGGIFPAVWSFMLAARSRGLGTVLTNLHLEHERDAAEVLDIPYDDVQQTCLIPVAYTKGTHFKPAARKPLDDVLHWDHWR